MRVRARGAYACAHAHAFAFVRGWVGARLRVCVRLCERRNVFLWQRLVFFYSYAQYVDALTKRNQLRLLCGALIARTFVPNSNKCNFMNMLVKRFERLGAALAQAPFINA